MTLQLESTTPEKMLSLIQDLADLPCSIMQKNLNKYVSISSFFNYSN